MGVMGAGLALEFKLRYPTMYADYLGRCQKNEVRLGEPYLYRDDAVVVLNFPTKANWKYPSKLPWIESGLAHFAKQAADYSIKRIAFPLLGCSKGGLSWDEVKPLMERYLGPLELEVIICMDNERMATGLEGKMVEILNQQDIESLVKDAKLKRAIAAKVHQALPLNRFRELLMIQGVGETSYSSLYRYISAKLQSAPPPVQLSLDLGAVTP